MQEECGGGSARRTGPGGGVSLPPSLADGTGGGAGGGGVNASGVPTGGGFSPSLARFYFLALWTGW